MYRWYWYRKLILEPLRASDSEGTDELVGRGLDRRARQAEILALGRLRRRDTVELLRAG